MDSAVSPNNAQEEKPIVPELSASSLYSKIIHKVTEQTKTTSREDHCLGTESTELDTVPQNRYENLRIICENHN